VGQVSVRYVFLNQHVSSLASHLYYIFQNVSDMFIKPIQCTQCCLKQHCIALSLSPYDELSSTILEINLPLIIIKVFTFLISFISSWFTFFYFITYVISFNYFITPYPSYAHHLITQLLLKLQWYEQVSYSNYTYLQLYLRNKAKA